MTEDGLPAYGLWPLVADNNPTQSINTPRERKRPI